MISRYSNKQVHKNGRPVFPKHNVVGDVAILRALGCHPLLTIHDLAQLNARSYATTKRRVRLLKSQPLEYVKVADSQSQQPTRFLTIPLAVHLTNRGVAYLLERGFAAKTPAPSINFIHQLTQNQTAAAFETSFRERLVSFEEIQGSSQAPENISRAVSVSFEFKDKTYEYNLLPDVGPFGIDYQDGTYRFCVIETDCATEPLTTANRDRQAIETKLAAYENVLASCAYTRAWGVPNLTVLFTTTTRTRMESMLALIKRTVAKPFHKSFAFQAFPTVFSFNKQPDTHQWVRAPWATVGGALTLG
jgi:hypothetical protein